MDPLALAAVVGLVFAGKTLSDKNETADNAVSPKQLPPTTRPLTRRDVDLLSNPRDHSKDFFDLKNTTPDLGRRIGDWRLQPKEAVASLQDVAPDSTALPYGQPVYDLYNRQYVTNKMNNLAPVERQNVGRGLGVDPSIPATGGFHDFFRVLPNNVNEERLTTLEGREGPANPVVKNGGAGGIGEITHEAKDTKAWTREPKRGHAAGQGGSLTGPEGRPDFLKSRRTTIRQETGERIDTLSSGPAQYSVYQPYAEGGDESYTNKTLTRSSGYREHDNRSGNPGRMNVREDPVNQVGVMSNLRAESVPVPVGPMNGSRFQNYTKPDFDKFDERRMNPNPLADPTCLDVAIQQLEKNSIAIPPLSVQ
jgi:hypothetical protein